MLNHQRLPSSGRWRRPRNSWRRSTLSECGSRSWSELRFIAGDRRKWKDFVHNLFLMEFWTLLLLLLLLLLLFVCGINWKHLLRSPVCKLIIQLHFLLFFCLMFLTQSMCSPPQSSSSLPRSKLFSWVTNNRLWTSESVGKCSILRLGSSSS
jgi:hypothetical protein